MAFKKDKQTTNYDFFACLVPMQLFSSSTSMNPTNPISRLEITSILNFSSHFHRSVFERNLEYKDLYILFVMCILHRILVHLAMSANNGCLEFNT